MNREIGLILSKDEEEISYSLFEEPKDFNVRSPGQLAKFLGIEKTSVQAINEFLEFNKDEDRRQLIERIMLFRENYKFYSTYGAGYQKFVGEDGRIHGELLQGKTATGRFASFSPNLQNFDRNIFKYLLKEEDKSYVMISADYSSVESRILAYEAGDELYIDSVNSTDVHAANARKMFKIPDDELVTAEQRSLAKGISFGVSYGISARGLYNRGLAASLEEGQEFIDNYFGTFVGVAKFLNNSKREALSTGKTQDSYGRIRWYDKPKGLSRKDEGAWQNKVERQAQNHKIQSGSANVTKYAIARLYEYTRTVNAMLSLILTVHDSIVGKSHRDKILTNCRKMLEIMESAGPTIIKGMISPVDLDVGNKLKLTCKVSGVEFSTYEYDFVKKNLTLKKLNLNYHPELKKLIKKHKWYGDMNVVSREFESWVVLHLSNIEKTNITKELSKALGVTEGFLKDVYSTKESR